MHTYCDNKKKESHWQVKILTIQLLWSEHYVVPVTFMTYAHMSYKKKICMTGNARK
jgi:hypothetical protein